MDAAQNNPFGDNLTFDAVQNEEPVTSSPIIESINNKYDIKIEAESITEWRKQFQASGFKICKLTTCTRHKLCP